MVDESLLRLSSWVVTSERIGGRGGSVRFHEMREEGWRREGRKPRLERAREERCVWCSGKEDVDLNQLPASVEDE